MKYIECMSDCQYGHSFQFKVSPEKIPLKPDHILNFVCPVCGDNVTITSKTTIQVLCHLGTNDVAVFEDEGGVTTFYGNQN